MCLSSLNFAVSNSIYTLSSQTWLSLSKLCSVAGGREPREEVMKGLAVCEGRRMMGMDRGGAEDVLEKAMR